MNFHEVLNKHKTRESRHGVPVEAEKEFDFGEMSEGIASPTFLGAIRRIPPSPEARNDDAVPGGMGKPGTRVATTAKGASRKP